MTFFVTNSPLPAFDLNSLILQAKLATEILLFMHNAGYCVELDKFVGYPTEDKAVRIGGDLLVTSQMWGVFAFQTPEVATSNGQSELPKLVTYKIRMNSSLTHNTIYTQDTIYYYGPSNCLGCNSYFLYGFIYMQDMLEKGIVEEKTNSSQEFGVQGNMTPYPCWVNDKFLTAISRLLPLFMVIAWIYTVAMMTKDIVYEKEKRLKEFMRVMGLSNGIHWMAWFLTSFVVMYFVTFLLAIILKYGKITTNSDISALFVFFCCFTIGRILLGNLQIN